MIESFHAPSATRRPQTHVEIFKCRRIPGHIALIWVSGLIYRVISAADFHDAHAAALTWLKSNRSYEL